MSNCVRFSLGNDKSMYNEEGKPWYDTVAGISDAVNSFEGFIELVSERQIAGYQRNEKLNEFYVLGRYSLDSCGNCGKITGWIPKEKLPDVPSVMTRDVFFVYLRDNIDEEVSISVNLESGLPFNGVICPVCKKGWDLHNCHDTVVVHKTEVFPLVDFVGKTLGEVKDFYGNKKDAVYRMQDDILIRNDHFIDRSPKYPGEHRVTEKWKERVVKNERGWVSSKDGISDDYVIVVGDEGFFNVWTYYHHTCNRLNLAVNEEIYFRDIFAKAGFSLFVLHHLPNGYCPCDICAPWFNVETEIGPITIGWRKRVINIDWSGILRSKKDILSLFSTEDVTKSETYIHAWSKDKAIEYISKIREAV